MQQHKFHMSASNQIIIVIIELTIILFKYYLFYLKHIK